MGGGSKEDAYTCDHLEKFELATFSSRVDVEIFLFWGGNVDQPIFFAKFKKVVERYLMDFKLSECVPVGVAWSPDHVPEVRFSVRTLIRFWQKFIKMNPLLFFFKLDFSASGNFRKRFLEISGNVSGNFQKSIIY